MKRVLLLLSGGFDSPVAGALLKKQGFSIAAVHFSQEPYTDSEPELKARKLASLLGFSPLEVVNISRELKRIADTCEQRFYFVLMKRLMLRKAEDVARQLGCDALATGESLGQVSSQTLDNLYAIDAAAGLPVLRPLIGLDKEEIIRRAQRLGTFEISKGKEMCDVLGPAHPSAQVRLRDVEAQEKLLA